MQQLSQISQNQVFVGIGANLPGAWGNPTESLAACLRVLENQGFSTLSVSSPYVTRPAGIHLQPNFVNVVAELSCDVLPHDLLRHFKRLECEAGRRSRVRNGPRPLDLDLLSFRNWVVNWPPPPTRPRLVLPHPHLEERPFVVVPLAEIAPDWRHPVTGRTARDLLRRLGGARHLARTGAVGRLDWTLEI